MKIKPNNRIIPPLPTIADHYKPYGAFFMPKNNRSVPETTTKLRKTKKAQKRAGSTVGSTLNVNILTIERGVLP